MDYLPAAALEQHVLATLRVLGLYHVTTLAERAEFQPQIDALTRNLHALGYALEQRHGYPWHPLLQGAKDKLALVLERRDGSTTADFLYETALASILALRHGPSDVRLAQPGLGLALVMLAVAIEHLLVLGSDAHPPEAPDLTALPFSPREEVLLEVARQLAALEYQDTLPPGHWATAASLRETAGKVREVMQHPGEDREPGAGLVVRQWPLLAGNNLEGHVGIREPPAVKAVSNALLRSLVTPNDSPLVLKHDTALALALEAATDSLVPSRVAGP